MGSVPGCYTRQRKTEDFCLIVTSTGVVSITTGTETESRAVVALYDSRYQRPPGKDCKLNKDAKNFR